MKKITPVVRSVSYTDFDVLEIRIQLEHPERPYAVAKVVFYLEDGTTDRESNRALELSKAQLDAWGEDDEVIYTIIAEQMNIILDNGNEGSN